MNVERRRSFSANGAPELELRFNGGFGGQEGNDVIGRALGRKWPMTWQIHSLVREGDAAVVLFRRIPRPSPVEERIC